MTEAILALETSSETCSVALWHKGQQTSCSSEQPRGHAANVLPMVHQLLSAANLKLSELDAIALTNGPGAFTSVRIGTAVTQGLAMGANLPVIAVSSLEVMALGAMRKSGLSHAMVALDARMDEVYFGAYQMNGDKMAVAVLEDRVCSPELIPANQLVRDIVWAEAGIGWQVYKERMLRSCNELKLNYVQQDFPSADDLMIIARARWRAGQTIRIEELVPVYLRDKVVSG